jgi:hypothetical protein
LQLLLTRRGSFRVLQPSAFYSNTRSKRHRCISMRTVSIYLCSIYLLLCQHIVSKQQASVHMLPIILLAGYSHSAALSKYCCSTHRSYSLLIHTSFRSAVLSFACFVRRPPYADANILRPPPKELAS